MKRKFARYRALWFLILLFSVFSTNAAILIETDTLRLRNFAIKAYISLLNRKPGKAELQTAISRFKLYSKDDKGRRQFVKDLVKSPEFSKGLFDLFRYEYLQGTDPDAIETQISDYGLLLSIKTQSDFADIFQKELDRFLALQQAEKKFQNREISYNTFQKTFFNNKFYDDINMGDHNFVTSTFNYLLYRNPTRYELEEGKKMFHDQYGILFTRSGSSRTDYLNLLFESNAWKEGNIRFWFNKLINRNPTHDELHLMMTNSKEFILEDLIEFIVFKAEFAGK